MLTWRVPARGFEVRELGVEGEDAGVSLYLVPNVSKGYRLREFSVQTRSDLYRDLVRLEGLAGAAFTEAARRFASRNGLLTRGMPLDLGWLRTPEKPFEIRTREGRRTFPTEVITYVAVEPLEIWRREVSRLALPVHVWKTSHAPASAEFRGSVVYSAPNRALYWTAGRDFDAGKELFGPPPEGIVPLHWPLDLPADADNTAEIVDAMRGWVRGQVQAEINSRIKYQIDGRGAERVPLDLIGALWMQFADFVAGPLRYVRCLNPACGKVWDAVDHPRKRTCGGTCRKTVSRLRRRGLL